VNKTLNIQSGEIGFVVGSGVPIQTTDTDDDNLYSTIYFAVL